MHYIAKLRLLKAFSLKLGPTTILFTRTFKLNDRSVINTLSVSHNRRMNHSFISCGSWESSSLDNDVRTEELLAAL